MRDVYARAGINPRDVGFVEAHGTGTKVGDPLEAGALHRFFGAGRTRKNPLYIGSVKSNVGHLENASGLVSIIKASLMLERGFILPNINYQKPHPAIPMDDWNLKVPVKVRPWPMDKRYLSVNNFGFGGSNAHVVLERPPAHNLKSVPKGGDLGFRQRLFVLSTANEESLPRLVSQVGIYMETHPELFDPRICRNMAFTLGERRSHLPYRVAMVADSLDALAQTMNTMLIRPQRVSKVPRVAFVFTGQGAQWPTMGTELLGSHPVFAKTVQAASDFLRRIDPTLSLVDALQKDRYSSIIGEPHISQPACTAIQLGLTDLLKSWGVVPSFVIGHSSGEIGAAYAAGAITLEEAMTVAYYRGILATGLRTKHPEARGGMMAVGTGPKEAKEMINRMGLDGITVACENSGESVTISGDMAAVDELATALESQGIFHRKLHVNVAYHSSHMQLVADEYTVALSAIKPRERGDVQFYSSLMGGRLDSSLSLGPSYWVNNLTHPVLFSTAFRNLCTEGHPDMVVEIGPHSALEGPIKQILRALGDDGATVPMANYVPSLLRNQNATTTAMRLAGALFVGGQALNFAEVNYIPPEAVPPVVITDFAPYPWSAQTYWAESRASKQRRLRPFARHDLLGLLEASYSVLEPAWRNILTLDDVPWLRHHRMQSMTTFPLSGYASVAVEAARQRALLRGIAPDTIVGYRLRELSVSKAFTLAEGDEYETFASLRPMNESTRIDSDDWDEYRFSSWAPGRGWLEHCRCLVSIIRTSLVDAISPPSASEWSARQLIADSLVGETRLDAFYSELERYGAEYGSIFQLGDDANLRASGDYAVCDVRAPDTAPSMPCQYEAPSVLSPAFLELIMQANNAILGAGTGTMTKLFMPSAIGELEVRVPPNAHTIAINTVRAIVRRTTDADGKGSVGFDVDAWPSGNTADESIIKIMGLRTTPVQGDFGTAVDPRALCYKVQWEPLAGGSDETNTKPQQEREDISTHLLHISKEPVVILTDRSEDDALVQELSSQLEAKVGTRPSVASLFSDMVGAHAYLVLSEMDGPLLANMGADVFERVQKLLLIGSSTLWVTTGAYKSAEHPDRNIAQGLLRTIRSETEKTVATLDLDPHSQLVTADRAALILAALDTSLARSDGGKRFEYEFAEEAGQLAVPRLVADEDANVDVFRATHGASQPYDQPFEQEGRRLRVDVATRGALGSLYWRDDPELPLGPDEIEIKAMATGLNHKDVVVAMGKTAQSYIGHECAGLVARVGDKVTTLVVGDRVCAVTPGAYNTFVRCPATSAVRVPEKMDCVTAASLPMAFSTAYYSLVEVARLQPGESVLIHAAAGGVGQAAVQLAQHLGAVVYATVGNVEKKRLLMDTYQIPASRIFSSRTTAFGAAVRAATRKNGGVDVVVNSLAGEFLREGWACVAPFGRFVDLGKRDMGADTRLEMSVFDAGCSFVSVDLSRVAAKRPGLMQRILQAVMRLLAVGAVQPVASLTTIGIGELESGLRMLQNGKTAGKVIVKHDGADLIKVRGGYVQGNYLRACDYGC